MAFSMLNTLLAFVFVEFYYDHRIVTKLSEFVTPTFGGIAGYTTVVSVCCTALLCWLFQEEELAYYEQVRPELTENVLPKHIDSVYNYTYFVSGNVWRKYLISCGVSVFLMSQHGRFDIKTMYVVPFSVSSSTIAELWFIHTAGAMCFLLCR